MRLKLPDNPSQFYRDNNFSGVLNWDRRYCPLHYPQLSLSSPQNHLLNLSYCPDDKADFRTSERMY